MADPTLTIPLSTARRASAAIRRITAADSRLLRLKDAATRIRAETAAALPNSLFDLKSSLERRGFVVHFAANTAQACEIVVDIASAHRVVSAVKSKSMATEEIGLNLALEKAGIWVTETDLGEFIVQLAGERPAHILAPAINKTASAVARIFVESGVVRPDEVDVDRPDREALTALARRHLRSVFLGADMGITGANFACAAEGVLVGISNEGNLRMCVSLPRIHVAVVPIEKVVRSLDDVAVLLPLLTATATAQTLTSYVSIIAGPRSKGEPDGPEESHVILLDNKRSAIPATRYEPILRCVRCGACLNACPVYTTMGGHAYGTTYMGPIGAVLATLIEEAAPSELPYASSLCGACSEICPVGIPLHEMLYELRADPRLARQTPTLQALFRIWALAWSRPGGFRGVRAGASVSAEIAERLGIGRIVGGPSGARRLVLADNRAGRLACRILRRRVVPVPPPLRELTTQSSHAVALQTSREISPTTEVAGGPLTSGMQSREDPGSSKSTTRRKPATGTPDGHLAEKFIGGLSRNGVRASLVGFRDLEESLRAHLQDLASAVADPALLEGRYGPRVLEALQACKVRLLKWGRDAASGADVGLAVPLVGVAETGSLLFAFGPRNPRLTTLLPPALVAIVPADRIVPDLPQAFRILREAGILSGAALVSGPSKTADIEMTLVNGVHGPGRLAALVVE